MNKLMSFMGYLTLWVILWSCLALLWRLPVDLPIKAAKGAVNSIAKMVASDPDMDTRENYHPLIDKLYQEIDDYNYSVNNRNRPTANFSSPSYPMGTSAYDPAQQIESISGTNFWPNNKTTNSFNAIDPYRRPTDPAINNAPYSGRITDTTKSAGWSSYQRPTTNLTGSLATGSTYQGSMAGAARSSANNTAPGRR